VRGRKAFNLPGVIWYVLGASFILFILAWLSILLTKTFLFYLPSRYTRVGLYLFLLMFVFLNIEDAIKEALNFVRRNPQKLVWLVVGIGILIVMLIIWYPSELATIKGFNMKWLLALAGILFTILGTFVFRRRLRAAPNFSMRKGTFSGRIFVGIMGLVLLVGWTIYAPVLLKISSLNPSQSERDLYDFITTLPKDALIAGTPCTLDSVPLFSKRQILFSCERYGKDDPVVFKALETYYTDDHEVLIGFCNDYDIDYLVVDSETYSTEYFLQGRLFFEPHNQKLLTEIGDRTQFILGRVPDEKKLFQADNYFVVPCDIAKW
jgi:putative Ca2+/H+ antiporter (TMEM165/GDT1 family)